MRCFTSPTVSTMTLCGAPIGLDWFPVDLAQDYRNISCRTCRGHWNYENPDKRIPVRELPYVQRYSVSTFEGTLRDLSWEEALLYFRSSREDQLARLEDNPGATVVAYLLTGERVISAILIIDGEAVVDTRKGIGMHHINQNLNEED